MEGGLSGTNLMAGHYGMLDLHAPLHRQQQQQHHHTNPLHHQQHLQHDFPIAGAGAGCGGGHAGQDSDHPPARQQRNCTSDEDEPSFNEEEPAKGGKKNSPWQRMKWSDGMVRLLITIVSYIGEDATSPDCGRRKLVLLQKKGKWKSVSKVMAARGCYVSPQQCEDKFNDLNKRYKRLTDVLGRGTSCKVVEDPSLLDSMTHLSEKVKEDVRKILSSKHLYYEEMCSYHNGNRLHLLNDPSLQQCLQAVLKGSDGQDAGKAAGDEQDEDDLDDGDDDGDDNVNLQGGHATKRLAFHHNLEEENVWAPGHLNAHECGKRVVQESQMIEMNEPMRRQWIKQRLLLLEEQKLSIDVQAFELETQRFKWQRFSKKKERELDRLRLENEKMKLENERMLLELRKKELEVEFKIAESTMRPG